MTDTADFNHLLTKVTVASGRSVVVPVSKVQNLNHDGTPNKVWVKKQFGPGEVIEISIDEAERLRSTGYVV